MHMDQPFPLDAVPSRVKNAILNEFKGRCPSIRDVAETPDSYWLSTPAIGSVHLAKIRNVIGEQPRQACPPSALWSDSELLDRLERLEKEVRWLRDQLNARLSKPTRRKPNRQWHRLAMQDPGRQPSSLAPSPP